MHRLHYNNQGQVNIWVCISYSVNSSAYTTPVRIYGEPYAHKFCVVDIFCNITRCQDQLRVGAWFHYSAGNILIFIKCFSANQNQLFFKKVKYINLVHDSHLDHKIFASTKWLERYQVLASSFMKQAIVLVIINAMFSNDWKIGIMDES